MIAHRRYHCDDSRPATIATNVCMPNQAAEERLRQASVSSGESQVELRMHGRVVGWLMYGCGHPTRETKQARRRLVGWLGGRPVIRRWAIASTHLTGTSSGVCFSFSDMVAGSLERQRERGGRERGGEGWSEKRERGGWEEELLAGGSYLNTAVTRDDGL